MFGTRGVLLVGLVSTVALAALLPSGLASPETGAMVSVNGSGTISGSLDNCKLITQSELVSIMRSPVQIRRGEGLTSCNFFWKGKRLIILSVGPAPFSGYQEIVRHARSFKQTTVTNLTIAGNSAAEIDTHIPGEYARAIQAFHNGNMIQLTTPPYQSAAVLPSLAQLRQIVTIIVRRF
jgi:hypothetical protein